MKALSCSQTVLLYLSSTLIWKQANNIQCRYDDLSYPQQVWSSLKSFFVHMDAMALHGWNNTKDLMTPENLA